MREEPKINKKFQEEVKSRYNEVLKEKKAETDIKHSRLQNYQRVQAEFTAFLMRFAGMMYLPVSAPQVQQLVAQWQNFITENFYTCSDEILQEFSILYLEDERFQITLNRMAPGLADYVTDAIKFYLENKNL